MFAVTVVQVGIGLQALSVALSSILLAVLLGVAPADAVLFQSGVPTGLYIALLFSAILEEFGYLIFEFVSSSSAVTLNLPYCFLFLSVVCSTVIMDISVERDWVPVVIPQHDLSRVNSLMRRIDLVTEGRSFFLVLFSFPLRAAKLTTE